MGSEKHLIYCTTGRKVPCGKMPFDVGVCVQNIKTMIAVYEAIENNIPLTQTVMTVSGLGIKEPKNLKVALGTSFNDIIEYCGDKSENTIKLVAGGPMMGKALVSIDQYARKTDSGLLVLEKGEANQDKPTNCINCGRCADNCPMRLIPALMEKNILAGEYKTAQKLGVLNCIECGSCAYNCPAKRSLVQSFNFAKGKLREIQMTYGIPVQSHLSESKGEIDFVKFLRPKNSFYGDSYNEYDLFGKNDDIGVDVKTVMAHCVWSTDEEVELMHKNGVFVAHCPASNMNLTSGIAPIRKYLDLGLNVGLGSDVAGGHSLSIFRAITDAIQVSKMYFRMVNENYKPLVFSESFYLATKGGGKFFGKVGSFEDGYEFDAIVLNDNVLSHPQTLNLAERMERAVYLGLDEKNLTAKFVAGTKVL